MTTETLNKQQRIHLLKEWLDAFNKIQDTYDSLHKFLGVEVESPVVDALYACHTSYTKVLAQLLGDQCTWLEWYLWDNQAGKNRMEATPSGDHKMRPIKTLEDLDWLITNSAN